MHFLSFGRWMCYYSRIGMFCSQHIYYVSENLSASTSDTSRVGFRNKILTTLPFLRSLGMFLVVEDFLWRISPFNNSLPRFNNNCSLLKSFPLYSSHERRYKHTPKISIINW